MGDTFFIELGVFCGHAVENSIGCWGALAVDEGLAPEGNVGARGLPDFRCQSQDHLQMETSVYGRRTAGVARRVSPATSNAAPSGRPLDQADQAVAPETSSLGCQEVACLLLSAGLASPGRANDCPLVEAPGTGASCSALPPQGVRTKVSGPDDGEPAPPGLERGFQGLVPCGQWGAVRTVDGAGFVQPLWAHGQSVAHAAVEAGAGSVYEAFPRTRDARSHSSGQWRTLCLDRAGRAFAVECLVGTVGNQRGVYATRLPAGQWGARTISSGDETRNGKASRLDASGAAASDDGLVAPLQPTAPPRGVRTDDAGREISQKSTEVSWEFARSEIWDGIRGAARSQQWRDPVGWSQTFYWRGLRGPAGRIAPSSSRSVCSLFRAVVDRTPARARPGSHASNALSASWPSSPKIESVTHVLASNCHPCVVTVPTPALS